MNTKSLITDSSHWHYYQGLLAYLRGFCVASAFEVNHFGFFWFTLLHGAIIIKVLPWKLLKFCMKTSEQIRFFLAGKRKIVQKITGRWRKRECMFRKRNHKWTLLVIRMCTLSSRFWLSPKIFHCNRSRHPLCTWTQTQHKINICLDAEICPLIEIITVLVHRHRKFQSYIKVIAFACSIPILEKFRINE